MLPYDTFEKCSNDVFIVLVHGRLQLRDAAADVFDVRLAQLLATRGRLLPIPLDPLQAAAADPELIKNPRRMFKLLRDHAPVHAITEGPRPGTLVSRYDDVLEVLRNPSVFSSGDDAVNIGQKRPLIPLQLDPPDQTMYRKLMAPLFAPKVIDALEAQTRTLAVELVEKVASSGGGRTMRDFADRSLADGIFILALLAAVECAPACQPVTSAQPSPHSSRLTRLLTAIGSSQLSPPHSHWLAHHGPAGSFGLFP